MCKKWYGNRRIRFGKLNSLFCAGSYWPAFGFGLIKLADIRNEGNLPDTRFPNFGDRQFKRV